MKAQFKYAFQQGLTLRLAAFAILVIMNVVFGVLGYFGLWGEPGMITAVTLSSLALFGIFTVNIIVDMRSLKDVFGTPDGYLHALTPVKSWKILLARTVAIVCQDFITLFAGIFGIVWQAMVLSGDIGFGFNYSHYESSNSNAVTGLIVLLLGYAYIIMLIVFGSSLKNSVLSGIPGRSWLALLGVAATAWIFNLFNFVVAPFGTVDHWRIFYSITLPGGWYMGFIVYALLFSVKIAALFIASSTLLERKNNL